MNEISGYVIRIDKEMVVVAKDMAAAVKLVKLGFSCSTEQNSYLLPLKNDQEKYALIEALRDEGFAFSDGNGWSPSEVVDYERDQGHVSGKFLRISWQSPNSHAVTSF